MKKCPTCSRFFCSCVRSFGGQVHLTIKREMPSHPGVAQVFYLAIGPVELLDTDHATFAVWNGWKE